MKVLVLCKRVPFPLTNGESLRIFNYARRLSRNHELHLLYLGDSPHDTPVNEVFSQVETVPVPSIAAGTPLQRLAGLFRIEAFEPQYASVEAYLRQVLPTRGYDVIWASSDMVTSIPAGFGVPLLADICDDNVLLLRRELAHTVGPVAFLRVLKRMLVARAYERRSYGPAQACLFVSDVDADSFRAISPATPVAVIPNGVDQNYFHPASRAADSATIVFEGSMDFQPNADAAVHLCRTILPRILALRNDVRVVLVGRDPTPEVKALASERVQVTGYVDDVRPYLAAATVFACPLRMGAGIKNKVLQAWSMGKAVVATPFSVGGLDCADGDNILIREHPDQIAGAVVMLLNDAVMRERIGARAREKVLAAHTWDAAALRFEALLASIANKR